MKYLVTGGCGFLGSNISSELLRKGKELVVFDSLYRRGSHENLQWLRQQGKFEFIHGDIRNTNDVERAVLKHAPDTIFHLAGQVAMTTSISDPRMDFEVNVGGTFNLLNAVRLYSPQSTIVYSSTNKVYGDLEQFKYRENETRYECIDQPSGFNEAVNLDFHSPYGTSKGSADQYMLDFARIYDLNTVVFRHSSMFGGRQFATSDQGWLGWFIQKAIEIETGTLKGPVTISGDGKQVRYILYESDCVDLYITAAENIGTIKGQAFNIGGGVENSSSLLELFQFLENEMDIIIPVSKLPARESDQRVFIADISKVKSMLNWSPKITKEVGIRRMVDWVRSQ
jgi:CDP-paratose 2-epimerase